MPAAVAAALSLSSLACSSSSSSSTGVNTSTVEYAITPASTYFIQVIYTGQNGQADTVSDLSTFPSGKKDISVSTRPFDAKIATVMNNTTAATINYTLVILVDGQPKAVTNGSCPPGNASYQTSAEFVVQ